MELSSLRGLYATPGPWASVCLDVSYDTPQARDALKIRWKVVMRALDENGVDARNRNALEEEVISPDTFRRLDTQVEMDERPHRGLPGLALFAAGGEVRYAEALPGVPRDEVAEVAALPHVTPLVVLRGEHVPWLRVIVNRTGADVQRPENESLEVQGTHTHHIRKTHGGGWSQEHLQRHAELHWLHNAKEIADKASKLAEQLGVELLVIAGDVRARELVIDELPRKWRERVVPSDTGSRAPGADLSSLDEVTEQAVADQVAQRLADAKDRFLTNNGAGAANGLRDVVDAFDQGKVAVLLLDPEVLAGAEVWLGPDISQLALSAEDLRALGAQEPLRVRADDALIRAAALTDAEVLVVSSASLGLTDGVGALVRYPG